MQGKIPTTIVTGFLGAGKTTLIRHMLMNAQGRRIALIINEFGDVGVDGEVLKGCGDALCKEEDVIELANGSGEIFLASISRKPAGFLCIESGPGKEWGAFVDNLHVLPHLRGANIGARLLARGEDWALRHDHRQLYLWVFEENHAARRFYRREGWRDAERQLHVIPGGDSRPVRRMIKRP